MRVADFGLRVGAVCVFSFVFSSTLDDTLVVAVGGDVALGERVVAGSEVTYSGMSVQARLPFASVKETSAGRCVTVFDVLSVVVVGTVVTRERRDAWATLACSAAIIFVRVCKQEKLAKCVPERRSSLLSQGALSQARSRRDVGEGS